MEIPDQPKSAQPESPKNTGYTLQVLANVLTIIVALAAIGLSIWEGRENRRYNRLSVLPHLEASLEVVQQATERRYAITYGMQNNGLGPAVIKNLYVFKDDQPIFDAATSGRLFDFSEFLDELNALPFQVGSFVHSRGAGELLATDKLHLLFRLYVPPEDSAVGWPPDVVREKVLDRYSFLFCYCSVYGEDCNQLTVGPGLPAGASCSF